MELEEIPGILRENMEHFRREYGVLRMAVFGSRVRGDHTEDSDLDVMADLEKPIGLLEFIRLAYEIEELVGIKVDLVTPSMVDKPLLKESVMEDVVYV